MSIAYREIQNIIDEKLGYKKVTYKPTSKFKKNNRFDLQRDKMITEDFKYNIFDLPTDKMIPEVLEKYKEFSYITLQNIEQYMIELSKDSGNICNIFNYTQDESNISTMEQLRKIYYDNYLKDLVDTPDNIHQKTNKNELYPNFFKDLYKKKNILEQQIVNNTGITPIREQKPNQFIKTIKSRFKGLKKCSNNFKNKKTNKKEVKYYNNELETETLMQPILNNNSIKNDEKIKKYCKGIFWGYWGRIHLNNSNNLVNLSKDYLEKFFIEYQYEKKFIKTILSPVIYSDLYNYIDNTYNINLDKLSAFLIEKAHIESTTKIHTGIRQYIFTLSKKNKIYDDLGLLYEGMHMQHIQNENVCNMLVEFTELLNTFYTKCSSTNNDVIFPIRFILPEKSDYDHILEKRLPQIDTIKLFNDTMKFIGMITIKYYYNSKTTSEKRLWILYIFKSKIWNYDIFGNRTNIVILNTLCQYINIGGLFSKYSITHFELYELSKIYGMNFYISELDNKTLFLSHLIPMNLKKYLINNNNIQLINELKLIPVKINYNDYHNPNQYYNVIKLSWS